MMKENRRRIENILGRDISRPFLDVIKHIAKKYPNRYPNLIKDGKLDIDALAKIYSEIIWLNNEIVSLYIELSDRRLVTRYCKQYYEELGYKSWLSMLNTIRNYRLRPEVMMISNHKVERKRKIVETMKEFLGKD